MKDFPHERSAEALEALARMRGSSVSLAAAEGFVIVREIDRERPARGTEGR